MKSLARCAMPVCVLVAFVVPAVAQPSLSTLWPVDLGRMWEFDVRVEGPFNQVETGTLTQTVASQVQLSSGAMASCFSVASTGLGGSPRGPLPSLLLAVPNCDFNTGILVDDQTAIGAWSDTNAGWEWWWITANPAPGSTFRLQIRTAVANDAFVNGEVRTISGAVTTPVGSFTNAVIVDYVVELGQSDIVEAGGGVLGTASFETVGWIAFVPGVGPVASEEVFAPAAIDCPACPPEIFEPVTTTMNLRATTPVGTERATFGSIKARF